MTTPLRRALAEQAVRLSQQVLDRMYENPFWMERYGERGRRFANEDSLHHVSYLDQALAADDAGVFERYALWLRTILVSRGMCSEHLAENFRLLAEAIAASGLPDAEDAQAILSRGDASLRYAEGTAGMLEHSRQQLLDAVTAAEPGGAAMRDDDRRYVVSYFIDAAATGNVAWFDTFAARCPAAIRSALTEQATSLGIPVTAPAPPRDAAR